MEHLRRIETQTVPFVHYNVAFTILLHSLVAQVSEGCRINLLHPPTLNTTCSALGKTTSDTFTTIKKDNNI